jgi:hypothetical protein
MGLTGVRTIAEIGPNVLVDPPFSQRKPVKKTTSRAKKRG